MLCMHVLTCALVQARMKFQVAILFLVAAAAVSQAQRDLDISVTDLIINTVSSLTHSPDTNHFSIDRM